MEKSITRAQAIAKAIELAQAAGEVEVVEVLTKMHTQLTKAHQSKVNPETQKRQRQSLKFVVEHENDSEVPQMSAAAIAEALKFKSFNQAAGALNVLSKKGFVVRSFAPEDKRAVYTATDEGKAHLAKLMEEGVFDA